MLLSLLIGSITFRLRGPYFVLASISVAEIIRLAALHFKDFTRGAEGFLLGEIPALHVFGAEIEFFTKRPFYFVGLALAVLSVLANWAVQHSKLGYYFQAIREDQDAAHSLGINLPLYKNVALAISAAFTACAGGFYAMFVKFIDPNTVFGLDVSVQIVLIAIIGGIGTILGPVIGAMVLVPLSEVLRNPKGLVQIGVLPADSGFVDLRRALPLERPPARLRHPGGAGDPLRPRGRPRRHPARRARGVAPPRGARRVHRRGRRLRETDMAILEIQQRLQVLRRPGRQLRRLLLRGEGLDHGPHRPERRRQDHPVQLHHRLLPALEGRGRSSRASG